LLHVAQHTTERERERDFCCCIPCPYIARIDQFLLGRGVVECILWLSFAQQKPTYCATPGIGRKNKFHLLGIPGVMVRGQDT
jgi:hypothetical protein